MYFLHGETLHAGLRLPFILAFNNNGQCVKICNQKVTLQHCVQITPEIFIQRNSKVNITVLQTPGKTHLISEQAPLSLSINCLASMFKFTSSEHETLAIMRPEMQHSGFSSYNGQIHMITFVKSRSDQATIQNFSAFPALTLLQSMGSFLQS